MTEDAAILSAVYTEWKMVKTRNALVLCFEVPLEQQELVQKVLGTPLQSTSTHVAIARLIDPDEREAVKEPEALPAPKKPLTLAAKAALLCKRGDFQRWAFERGYPQSEDGATKMIYDKCSITSRSEITEGGYVEGLFRQVQAEFDRWCQT